MGRDEGWGGEDGIVALGLIRVTCLLGRVGWGEMKGGVGKTVLLPLL